jgi:hypothetical protein
MKHIAAAVADGSRKHVEPGGFFAIEVVEDRPTAEIILNTTLQVLPHAFEQGVTGCDPFQGRVVR